MKTLITKLIFATILFTTTPAAQDSISVADSNSVDTTFIMQKSAWGAVLRSAVVPGWGQIYNDSYLKAPIVWGICGWFVYNYILNNNNYTKYKKLYLTEPSATFGDVYKLRREFYRDQRDLFAMYFVFAYLGNLVDAYVDAHLFDFSVTEDFYRHQPMLNLKINF